ncbi:MAG TPA: hypothetical protein VK717_10315 [Opitutaceae bacterium]|jgi:hypothetical protein|nr:hypothetical protein [Opitutaceae bacterium]
MLLKSTSIESGFTVGGRSFHLSSCEGELGFEIQQVLSEAYRSGVAVTCLCRASAVLPLEICCLQNSRRYYLKRKSVFHPHSDGCFLNQRQDSSPQSREVELAATIFEMLAPSASTGRDVTQDNEANTEIDGETGRTIRTFGGMIGHLLAKAYIGAVLPSPDGDKHLFRSPSSGEILGGFADQIAMARVEERNGQARISSRLIDLARRQEVEPFWGVSDELRFEKDSAGTPVRATISARNWKRLPRFQLEPNFELSGVHHIFGEEVPGPYFFTGLTQANAAATRLLKLFLYPVAACEQRVCPVESTAERRWLEQAWAQGRAPIKILNNRAIMPLLQPLAERPALALAEGLRRRWRPDFIEMRAGRSVVIEIAGLTNDPEYAANLAAKERFWRLLAGRGDFDYEIYASTSDGGFKRMSSVCKAVI